jgi:cell division protein FtsL
MKLITLGQWNLNSENKLMHLESAQLSEVESSTAIDAERAEVGTALSEVKTGGDSGAERHHRSRRKHYSRRHRHSQGGRHWSERSKLLGGMLTLALLANFFILLYFGLKTYSLNEENTDLRVNLLKSQDELNTLKPQVEKLQKDLESLLKGQLPGLMKIEYDQVMSLNNRYLKNITFNKVNNKNIRGYEFRIVMRNNTLSTIWPKFKIHFFDRYGVQMNSVQVSLEKESFLKIDVLEPGEERSDSSTVITLLDNEEMPSYFMIKLN